MFQDASSWHAIPRELGKFQAGDMKRNETPPVLTQAAKRDASKGFDRAAHLRLGVTLPGMRELLSELPSDAVEQINAKIPLDKKTGKPKYPKNEALDSTATSNNS